MGTAVLTLAAVALVAGGVAIAVRAQGADDDIATRITASEQSSEEDEEQQERVAEMPAEALFSTAAGHLADAGTFTYEGTSRLVVTDPVARGSDLVDRDVHGEVELPERSHEVVDQPDGSRSEIVVDSPLAWSRTTAFPERIGARPWREAEPGEFGFASHRLALWLEQAEEHRDGGEDDDGHRVVHAEIDPPKLGGVARFADGGRAELTLTAGDAGRPLSLEVVLTVTEADVSATYELDDLGDAVDIARPTDRQIDETPFINEEDITELGGPLIGLRGAPPGWILGDARVSRDPVGACHAIQLAYTDLADPVAGYLVVSVFSLGCTSDPPGSTPFGVSGYSGAAVAADGIANGVVRSGEAAIAFETDLSLDDLARVLSTLGPLDLRATLDPIVGVPSTAT